MFKSKFFLVAALALTLTLGTLLRVVALDKNPVEMFGDELDAGYQAYSLSTTGKDYRGNPLPVYAQSFSEWRAPGLMYAMVPFVRLFGLNEWGVRLTAAFWGIISLIGFSLLLKEAGVEKGISLLTIFLLSISPWHIQYSRASFEITLLSALIIFGSWLLLKALRSKSYLHAAASALIYSLSFYTYNTANVFVPMVIVGIITIELRTLTGILNQKRLIAAHLFPLFLLVSPLVINILFGHAADRYKQFSVFNDREIVDRINYYRSTGIKGSPWETAFHNKFFLWTKKIISNYGEAFSTDFVFGHGDVTFRHSLHEVGGVFFSEALFIIVGLVFLIKSRDLGGPAGKLMLYWLLISPIPASLTVDGGKHASRLFYLVFPLAFFAAKGVSAFWEKAKGKAVVVGLTLTLIFEFFNYQHYYWVHYPKESWRWWHYGYKEAVTSLNLLASSTNYRRIIIENTYEPAYIRYLFWTRIDPRTIFNISDTLKPGAVDGLSGFCLPGNRVCFVDFDRYSPQDIAQANTLYLISQERNVPGDWDWEKSPPRNIKVVKTVRNPYGTPLFYLITTSPSTFK